MKRMKPLLGTFVEIGITSSETNTEQLIERAFEEIILAQKLFSFHDPQSDLNRLNLSNGEEVTLHPKTIQILRLANFVSTATQGIFNITVGGQLQKIGLLPVHSSRKKIHIGHPNDIQILGKKAKLLRPVKVTLDGIAKGFAVDLAVMVLQRQGASGGWVNAGGDLRVFGDVEQPIFLRKYGDCINEFGKLKNLAIATSQVSKYQNPTLPGKILGLNKSLKQEGTWSVIAKSAWKADALTKVSVLATDSNRAKIFKKFRAFGVYTPSGSAL